jgi:hypothetical protein
MANSINDFLHPYKVRLTQPLDPPVLTASVVGSTGSTSYEYMASFVTLVGESLPSASVTVADGNASLNGFNKIQLAVASVPASVNYVRFWKNVSGAWTILCDVAPDPSQPTAPVQLYDTGQTTTTGTPAITNTSGRPGVLAICPKPGTYNQRINWMDLQAILIDKNQQMWDSIHSDGDVINGCGEMQVQGTARVNSQAYNVGDVVYVDSSSQYRYQCTTAGISANSDPGGWPIVIGSTLVDGNVTWTTICNWKFASGKIYLFGTYIEVPAGEVSLIGVGSEKAGLTVTPFVTTPDQDIVQRASIDEGVPPLRASTGPDWLYVQVSWVTGSSVQVLIKEFVDGYPKQATIATQRTELEIELARQRYDTCGSFVAEPFGLGIVPNPASIDQLGIRIDRGKAYPMGYEIAFQGTQTQYFNKARDTQFVNNSSTGIFDCPGGYIISANVGPFSVDGKSIAIQIGNGNTHTVTFAGSCTNAQICTQIESVLNSYPNTGSLVLCTAATSGAVEIQAIGNKSLTFTACTNDAYSLLGISIGTYSPIGTRIYKLNNSFIKDVSDLNYRAPNVAAITHNTSTDIDVLPLGNIIQILGASNTLADAYDGKWNYTLATDFIKDGDNISFAGMGGAKPTGTYYVSYQYERTAVKGTRQLVTVTDVPITKGTSGGQDNLTYTGAVSVVDAITGAAISPSPSGVVVDAITLLRVNNSAGQSQTQYTNCNLLKNATALALNTSQLDWSKADTSLTATGQPQTLNVYYATFQAWLHNVEGDYVSSDSYSSYENIESFAGQNLRDTIDFRCAANVLPVDGQEVILDYDFYLGRIDKLVLDSMANFYLLTGIPALIPQVPPDQDGALSLAIISISPYTYSVSGASITNLQVLRVTQAGIQRMQEQIDALQYSTVVQSLTNQVASIPTTGTKVALFADPLTGFGNCDLNFDTVDSGSNEVKFTAAIDRVNKCVRLSASQDVKVITVDNAASSHVRQIGNSLMLDYEPVQVKSQPYASVWINGASDFQYTNYAGIMFISPQTDVFVDQNQAPAVNVDFANNLSGLTDAVNSSINSGVNNANSVNWGSWQVTNQEVSITQGSNVDISQIANASEVSSEIATGGYHSTLSDVFGHGTFATRTGIQTTLLPGSIQQDLGNSISDLSLQGMMRTQNADGSPFTIKLNITGLMPNVDHACTVGGIPVDLVYDAQPLDPNGGSANYQPVGTQGSNTYQGKECATTSNIGSLTAKIAMPSGIPIGNTTISVFYYAAPMDSSVSATFYSAGFMMTSQDTTIGLPTTTLSTKTITQTGYNITCLEPLCETFYSGDVTTYYSQIELFFKSKSSTLGYTVQICPVVNGYPNTSQVLASTHLLSSDINVSDDGSVGTTFVFENVLGYQPNTWYCFNGIPDQSNTDYNLWAIQLGDIDELTSQRVTAVSAEGVLFHSPNNSTWEPKEKTYLKYNIYKSNFQNNCQIVFDNLTGVQASLLCLQVQQFISPGTGVVWSYSIDNKVTWIPFTPGINTDLGSIVNQICLMIDVTSIGGNYQIIEEFVGIVLLYHNASGDYIGNDHFFTNNLNYPNHVTCTLDLQTDGVCGSGVRSVTPYFTPDDGKNWIMLQQKPNDNPPASGTSGYYTYTFQTPPEASVSGVTCGAQTTIISDNHGFQNNAVVVITGVGGVQAANGTYRVTAANATSFQILDPITGVAIASSGTYSTGGTINMAEFQQFRPRVNLTTSNRATTPKVMNIGMVPCQL